MLRKYFISNITIMLLLNLLVKPVWIFLIDRNVQLQVGHDEYGLYTALVSLTIIFNILLDLGITNYNNKNLAAGVDFIETKLPNMIAAKGILSAVYFVVVFVVAVVFQYSERAIHLIFLLAVVQMLNSFLLFLRSNVSANHDFKTDSLLSVLDKILMIGICSFLLFSPFYKSEFVIEWFIYAQIIAYLLAVLVALLIIIRRYSKINFSHFSLKEVFSVCKKSIPYALFILLMAAYMRTDLPMLERLVGAEESSIYQLAYRILDAANMIAFLFAGILLPMFSRMLSKKISVENLVATTANIMLTASLALVAFCIIYARNILSLLYPDDTNSELILIFSFLIASFPAYCIMYIYSTLLTANWNISLLIKIALFGSIFSISLNVVLIHFLHALGAAITCFSVQWVLGFIYISYCVRNFQLSVDYKRIGKFILVLLLMFILNVVLHYFNVPLLYAIGVNTCIFLFIVYSIKLWDRKIIESYLDNIKR